MEGKRERSEKKMEATQKRGLDLDQTVSVLDCETGSWRRRQRAPGGVRLGS